VSSVDAPVRPPAGTDARLPLRDAMRTSLALIERDLYVLVHGFPGFALRTSMQPGLFAFVFAYVFPRVGQQIGGGGSSSFADVLLPGLMASSLMFQGIQAVALPLVQEFSVSREIEDRVMAPVPIWTVGLTKVISGAIQGVIAAIVVVPAVWIASGREASIDFGHPFLLVTIVPLGALVSAALGLMLGTITTPRRIQYLFALLLLPMTLLGAVYYPWSALSSIRWLQVAVLVNPVVYMSEGLRAALAPDAGHMSLLAVYGLLLGALAVLLLVSLRNFRRRVLT
jgi:ABC-2 type transport system permease protein